MLLVGLLALAGTDTPAMTPSGKWTVDYRADKCVGSRPFGNEPATYLIFEPNVSLDIRGAHLIVLAPNKDGSGARYGKATIVLQPSGATSKLDYKSIDIQANGERSYDMFADAALMAQIGDSTGLTVDAGKETAVLATGKLQPILDAAAKCNDDLMRSWGADPASPATPIGNPGTWFTNDDYPAAAAEKHAQGRVIVVTTVDNDGKLKACRVVATSGDPDLDKGTCDKAREHARFSRKAGPDRFSVMTVNWALLSG